MAHRLELRVGPSNTIRFNTVTNKGEAYQELRKCFGALGSINH
eukprot:SAG11_NODE_19083_length_474_cov_2.160000_1_plen_42_part_10